MELKRVWTCGKNETRGVEKISYMGEGELRFVIDEVLTVAGRSEDTRMLETSF